MTHDEITRVARAIGDAINEGALGETYEHQGKLYRDVDGAVDLEAAARAAITALRADT